MTILTKTLVLAFLVATPIAAKCMPHEMLVGVLDKKYSEVPVSIGIVGSKRYMETFASPSGTWTIAITDSSGVSCILAAGENYEDVPESARSLIGTPS